MRSIYSMFTRRGHASLSTDLSNSGHTFDVIQSASGGPPNYVNPPRRDVVTSGGTVDNPVRIRFRTDNPGK